MLNVHSSTETANRDYRQLLIEYLRDSLAEDLIAKFDDFPEEPYANDSTDPPMVRGFKQILNILYYTNNIQECLIKIKGDDETSWRLSWNKLKSGAGLALESWALKSEFESIDFASLQQTIKHLDTLLSPVYASDAEHEDMGILDRVRSLARNLTAAASDTQVESALDAMQSFVTAKPNSSTLSLETVSETLLDLEDSDDARAKASIIATAAEQTAKFTEKVLPKDHHVNQALLSLKAMAEKSAEFDYHANEESKVHAYKDIIKSKLKIISTLKSMSNIDKQVAQTLKAYEPALLELYLQMDALEDAGLKQGTLTKHLDEICQQLQQACPDAKFEFNKHSAKAFAIQRVERRKERAQALMLAKDKLELQTKSVEATMELFTQLQASDTPLQKQFLETIRANISDLKLDKITEAELTQAIEVALKSESADMTGKDFMQQLPNQKIKSQCQQTLERCIRNQNSCELQANRCLTRAAELSAEIKQTSTEAMQPSSKVSDETVEIPHNIDWHYHEVVHGLCQRIRKQAFGILESKFDPSIVELFKDEKGVIPKDSEFKITGNDTPMSQQIKLLLNTLLNTQELTEKKLTDVKGIAQQLKTIIDNLQKIDINELSVVMDTLSGSSQQSQQSITRQLQSLTGFLGINTKTSTKIDTPTVEKEPRTLQSKLQGKLINAVQKYSYLKANIIEKDGKFSVTAHSNRKQRKLAKAMNIITSLESKLNNIKDSSLAKGSDFIKLLSNINSIVEDMTYLSTTEGIETLAATINDELRELLNDLHETLQEVYVAADKLEYQLGLKQGVLSSKLDPAYEQLTRSSVQLRLNRKTDQFQPEVIPYSQRRRENLQALEIELKHQAQIQAIDAQLEALNVLLENLDDAHAKPHLLDALALSDEQKQTLQRELTEDHEKKQSAWGRLQQYASNFISNPPEKKIINLVANQKESLYQEKNKLKMSHDMLSQRQASMKYSTREVAVTSRVRQQDIKGEKVHSHADGVTRKSQLITEFEEVIPTATDTDVTKQQQTDQRNPIQTIIDLTRNIAKNAFHLLIKPFWKQQPDATDTDKEFQLTKMAMKEVVKEFSETTPKGSSTAAALLSLSAQACATAKYHEVEVETHSTPTASKATTKTDALLEASKASEAMKAEVDIDTHTSSTTPAV